MAYPPPNIGQIYVTLKRLEADGLARSQDVEQATRRWVRADLGARRVQAILTVAVVAGVVAALLLAAMLLEGTTNPWQGLFARTRGADVMIRFGYGTDLAKLDALPG